MNSSDPIELLFGGMGKLGPGSNADTAHVLHLLPKRAFHVVVDAGCGSGRQTLVLAKELKTVIHAVDLHQPFLDEVTRRANEQDLGSFVQTHCMDMRNIPAVFRDIDLLWSEGAAYNIGFSEAMLAWAPAIRSDGIAVISECSWITDRIPLQVKEYFSAAYPAMRSVQLNVEAAISAGYKVLHTYILPRHTWIEGYYDILRPRAKALADHAVPAVREVAVETLREIEIFESSEDSYGYVFYILQRAQR